MTHGIKIPGEYIEVSRTLYALGVGAEATAAHAMGISAVEAQSIVTRLCGIDPSFRGYRGRAKKRGAVTLPAAQGSRSDGVPHLRLGIVIHECAHILAWREHGPRIRPHGAEFCATFAKLLKEF